MNVALDMLSGLIGAGGPAHVCACVKVGVSAIVRVISCCQESVTTATSHERGESSQTLSRYLVVYYPVLLTSAGSQRSEHCCILKRT